MSPAAQIVTGLGVGILLMAAVLGMVRLIVGDPHMFRDMWECRERPVKRWKERRRR